ncbi:MAG: hypothetical protein GY855_14515 [candidate division Zixibacteria bacterium]|nr:hypothetical protein [candidate division Zixibacteria bacterium]
MSHVVEQFIPIVILLVLAYAMKLFLDHRIRRKLIDKGVMDENIKNLYQVEKPGIHTSLKWGMVFTGVGFAFLVGQFLPEHYSEGVTISLALIMAGLALLVFYFIEANAKKGGGNL